MKHRNKIGDVFAISLLNEKYAYGRLFLEGSVAFYKYRSGNINNFKKAFWDEFLRNSKNQNKKYIQEQGNFLKALFFQGKNDRIR